MAAAFQDDAFDFVDDLVGREKDETNKGEVATRHVPQRGRAGLGATGTTSPKEPTSIWTEKKLIPKSRKKYKGDDDQSVTSSSSSDDSDDQAGRTALEAPPRRVAAPVLVVETKKKKKLKKKTKSSQSGEGNGPGEAPAVTEETTVVVETSTDMPTRSFTRKRKKIRSKQKNIYRDKRPMNSKPQHLRPGNRHYEGRPLTEATRAKLQLPAKNPSAGSSGNVEVWDPSLVQKKNTPSKNAKKKNNTAKSKYKNLR